MNRQLILFFVFLTFAMYAYGQKNPLEKLQPLIGNWKGNGSVGESKSEIHSGFNWAMNNKYIEVKNHSEFEPTEKNKDGEIHDDWGMISYDHGRKKIVFRQFHVEGFVNQYILNDSLSNDTVFIFESEIIENFVPGGRARYTLRLEDNSMLKTIFDIGMPGNELQCYGTNLMRKQ